MGTYHIGDAIKQLTQKNSRLGNGLKAAKIEEVWEEIMGKTIAKYTQKIQIIHQTLFITTHIGPLKNELYLQKELILQRLNEVYGTKVVDKMVIQ